MFKQNEIMGDILEMPKDKKIDSLSIEK